MIAMTTNNSMSVKATSEHRRGLWIRIAFGRRAKTTGVNAVSGMVEV
jgi:hypothetical protein